MTSPIPHHVNPTTPATTAMAPYNFVPLPQAIFTVEGGIDVAGQKVKPWECHDQFVPGTHSGWIDLEIKALTPLFIRGAVRQLENGDWDTRSSHLRSEPFRDHQDCPMIPGTETENTPPTNKKFRDHHGRPMIPGSSLRGMIRNLVEILSFSKIQPVSNKQPFFRTVADDRLGKAYRAWFIEDLGRLTSGFDITTQTAVTHSADAFAAKVRVGIVRINGSHRAIEECGLARVERRDIEQAFGGGPSLVGTRPNLAPNPVMQHQAVYVTADRQPRDYFFPRQVNRNGRPRHPDLYLRFRRVQTIATTHANGLTPSIVVITGDMQFKHLEFVFLTSEAKGAIQISDEKWERFHDDDQITPWQECAFPKRQPRGSHRPQDGHLRDGEPVFFLADASHVGPNNPQGLVFFGRAQMFRFPYDETPASLVPESLRVAGLDLAEAMFGCVPQRRHEPKQTQQKQQQAIKGRVFFEDCVVTEPGQWLAPEMVPQILGSPKVTAYQQYLTQNGKADARQHTTYIKGDTTTIRGHKLYWHRWDESRKLDQVKNQNSKVSRTQTTLIQPVAETNAVGQPTIFSGRIRFENLTDIELGALLSTLNLPEECAHKIGMGKPLGLGSIRVTATLQLVDHTSRYQSWGNTGVTDNDGSKFIAAFTAAIEQHATKSNEPRVSTQTGLRRIARLDALFLMLQFAARPDRVLTDYLSLQQFRARPVLPTPHNVSGQSQPDWPGPIPSPGPDGVGHQPSNVRYSARSSSPQLDAPPQPPPKPLGKSGKHKETAKFIQLHKKKPGQAKIRLEGGAEIDCTGVNAGLQLKPNDAVMVHVDYDDGKPTQARFRRRS